MSILLDGSSPCDIVQIDGDGTIETIGDFRRSGYSGAVGGMALVKDTVFVIGDQQTAQNEMELWRTAPGGEVELVWFRANSAVVDLESYDNKAWFLTVSFGSIIDGLWRVTAGGHLCRWRWTRRSGPCFWIRTQAACIWFTRPI